MSVTFRLSALQFLQNALFACTVISVGTYLLGPLGFSGREVGMVYATNAVAATVTPLAVGWLADRYFSADRLLALLNGLAAVALIVCFSATSFGAFYAAFLAFNLAFIPTFGLLNAICFHQLDDPARTFPRVRAWGTVSFFLIGIGLSFFELETTAVPLLVAAALAVLTVGLALTLPRVPPQPAFDLRMLVGPEVGKILREPGMMTLLVALLLSCVPSAFYYSFVNPFLNEVGWTNAAAKMSLGQLVEIGIIVALPWVLARLRFRRVVFWGLLCWGLRYFFFAFARPGHYEWLLYAGILVQGIAFAWIVIAAQIYVDNRVPTGLRSTAQGLVSFANQGFGMFVGSWIAGEVVLLNTLGNGLHDWTSIWLVPGTFGLLAAGWFWWRFPRAGRLAAEAGD